MDFAHVCCFPGCTEQELLPGACQGCSQYFCVNHLQWEKHSCTSPPSTSRQTRTCPDCSAVITFLEGDDGDLSLALHLSSDCSAQSASASHPKGAVCQMDGCSNLEILPIVCGGCGKQFCVKHRVLEQHQCPQWLADQARIRSENEQRVREEKRRVAVEQLKKKDCQNTIETAYGLRAGATRSDDDVILKVHFSSNIFTSRRAPIRPCYFHFSPSTSVGRALDAICRQLDLPNDNHMTRDPERQLWLHSAAAGIPMVNGASVVDFCASSVENVILGRGRMAPTSPGLPRTSESSATARTGGATVANSSSFSSSTPTGTAVRSVV